MNPRRTMAFTRRALLQFRHDRRTIAFILVMPLMMMLIFGYTFGGEVHDVRVSVVDLDEGIDDPHPMRLSSTVRGNLGSGILTIDMVSDPVRARERVDSGRSWAAIIFPPGFTSSLMIGIDSPGNGSYVEVYLDGSNPTIASAVIKAVNEAIRLTVETLAEGHPEMQVRAPISMRVAYAYGGEDTRFIDHFAPGVVCFAIMMVTTMITIILFVNERRTGTLERVLATPASEAEVVVGYAAAFTTIGVIQGAVVLGAAIFIFGVSVAGSVALAFLIVVLVGSGHQGLGILLSAGARNELQAIQFVPMVLFPSILLSGLFWPVESIPHYLQPLATFIPLRYGIDAERSVMLRGWGVAEIWTDLAVLGAFAAVTISGSILLLRRRE